VSARAYLPRSRREQAEQDSAAAKDKAAEADNETDRAKAEADQAQADAQAAESKAAVAGDCAKAHVSAFGALFEGESVQAQVPVVREQFAGAFTGRRRGHRRRLGTKPDLGTQPQRKSRK
jgi:hypothetical protein